MVEDQYIAKKSWGGQVPVVFDLAVSEITSLETPPSFFVSTFVNSPGSSDLRRQALLPRISYLPVVTSAVRNHFLPFAPAREDEMWFESSFVALKWLAALIQIGLGCNMCPAGTYRLGSCLTFCTVETSIICYLFLLPYTFKAFHPSSSHAADLSSPSVQCSSTRSSRQSVSHLVQLKQSHR